MKNKRINTNLKIVHNLKVIKKKNEVALTKELFHDLGEIEYLITKSLAVTKRHE